MFRNRHRSCPPDVVQGEHKVLPSRAQPRRGRPRGKRWNERESQQQQRREETSVLNGTERNANQHSALGKDGCQLAEAVNVRIRCSPRPPVLSLGLTLRRTHDKNPHPGRDGLRIRTRKGMAIHIPREAMARRVVNRCRWKDYGWKLRMARMIYGLQCGCRRVRRNNGKPNTRCSTPACSGRLVKCDARCRCVAVKRTSRHRNTAAEASGCTEQTDRVIPAEMHAPARCLPERQANSTTRNSSRG